MFVINLPLSSQFILRIGNFQAYNSRRIRIQFCKLINEQPLSTCEPAERNIYTILLCKYRRSVHMTEQGFASEKRGFRLLYPRGPNYRANDFFKYFSFNRKLFRCRFQRCEARVYTMCVRFFFSYSSPRTEPELPPVRNGLENAITAVRNVGTGFQLKK